MAVAIVLLSPAFAVALLPVTTVGSGVACDYSDVATALDSVASASFQIAVGTYTVDNELVVNRSLNLRGGYTDACDGQVAGSGTTVLQAASGKRHFAVTGSVDTLLTLQDLELTGGTSALGGSLFVSGPLTTMSLINSVITTSSATDGGAVYVGNGAQFGAGGATLTSNMANGDGGAIHCDGATVFLSDTNISDNEATSAGGGVYGNNCSIGIYAANSSLNQPLMLFDGNEATHHGGAVAAIGDSEVVVQETIANGSSFTTFRLNTSGNSGGALYVASGAQATVGNAVFNSNSAGSNGGAIATHGQTQPAASCLAIGPCMFFFDNSAVIGGAVYVSETSFTLQRALALGNDARDGGFLWGDHVDSIEISSTVIAETPATSSYTIGVDVGTNVKLHGLTIAANSPNNTVLGAWGVTDFSLERSIVWGSAAPLFDFSGSSAALRCNLVENVNTLPPGAIGTAVLDPEFETLGFNEYVISSSSPARDRCASGITGAIDLVDIYGSSRPLGSLVDAGAHEQAHLFADGFESGNTQQW